jgi:hypothetical protein
MELLAIEQNIGRLPAGSRMEWDEHLHLCALLRGVRRSGRASDRRTLAERGEVLSKLLARGFEHQYASRLITLAGAGVQSLAVLVREATLRSELGRIEEL